MKKRTKKNSVVAYHSVRWMVNIAMQNICRISLTVVKKYMKVNFHVHTTGLTAHIYRCMRKAMVPRHSSCLKRNRRRTSMCATCKTPRGAGPIQIVPWAPQKPAKSKIVGDQYVERFGPPISFNLY